MSKISDNSNVVSTSTTSKPLEGTDRRKTLKKLGIGAGVGTVWATPIVQTVVLPAHAETTKDPGPSTTTTTLAGTTTTALAGTTTTTLAGTTTTTLAGTTTTTTSTTTTTTTTIADPACTDLTIELNWEVERSSPCVDLDLEVAISRQNQ